MNKYDRMLAVNKQASEAKIEKARTGDCRHGGVMGEGKHPEADERTGLSRRIPFIRTAGVGRRSIGALKRQAGPAESRREVWNMAMNMSLRMSHAGGRKTAEGKWQMGRNWRWRKRRGAWQRRNVGVLKIHL